MRFESDKTRRIKKEHSNADGMECPYCKVGLEEKSVSKNDDGSVQVLALCNKCLRTWRWYRKATGKTSPIEQYFFG